MADNEQHYLEVQVIPGTPPPSSLLTLQIPSGSQPMTIHRQQSSPLWSGDSNDSFNFEFSQFAGPDDFVGNYTDEISTLGSSSTSGVYLSPGSPSSTGSYSPLLDSFQDFSIASASPVASSPLMPNHLAFDGSDLPFNFDQVSWPKNSSDFLTPSLYAPSPQRSYNSPGSSLSELSSDFEATGSTSLVRRHSHSMSQDRGLEYLRSNNNQQLPLRRARSISVVRSRSPYDRSDSSSLLTVPSPSRSPAPPFPEPEIPTFSPEISITAPSDESDEATVSPSASTPREQIASAAVLRASEKRRTKKANFKCYVCGNCLTSKDNLNNHIDAHNNVRRHPCDHCGERFRTRSVLRRHQNSNKCKSRVKSANAYVSKLHCS